VATKIKNLILFSVASAGILFSADDAMAQVVYCNDYNSGADLLNATNNNLSECVATPEFAKFTVYDISLCTSRPDVGSTSSCTSIFGSVSGREILVSDSETISLNPNITIPHDDYSYATLTLDNRYGIKAVLDMGFTVGGWVDPSNNTNIPSTQGEHCWTNGLDIDLYGQTSGNVRCGATAQIANSQAAVSHETVFFLEDSPNMTASYDGLPSIDGSFDIRLINSAGQLAAVDPVYIVANNTDKLFVIIPLPSVQRVDENSSNIDVGFMVTDMMNLKVQTCSDGATPSPNMIPCIQNAIINSIGFYTRIE
jgi:hypothetical protein